MSCVVILHFNLRMRCNLNLLSAYSLMTGNSFVLSGAKSATPDQGSDANICPQGSYCLEGTDEPEPCPAGTFSNDLGKENQLVKRRLLYYYYLLFFK